jgi:hypothetical protein
VFFCFVVVLFLSLFRCFVYFYSFVCTSVELLPPGESPVAVVIIIITIIIIIIKSYTVLSPICYYTKATKRSPIYGGDERRGSTLWLLFHFTSAPSDAY